MQGFLCRPSGSVNCGLLTLTLPWIVQTAHTHTHTHTHTHIYIYIYNRQGIIFNAAIMRLLYHHCHSCYCHFYLFLTVCTMLLSCIPQVHRRSTIQNRKCFTFGLLFPAQPLQTCMRERKTKTKTKG